MFERVLIATDGSPPALVAARLGGALCGPAGHVRLLHVTSGLRDLAAMGFDAASTLIAGAMGDLRERVQLTESAEAARLLEQARAVVPEGRKVETFERSGRPASVILDEADRADVDVVVMGSRGRGSIARAVFGSVADAVARGAMKPVLIARMAVSRQVLAAVDGSESSQRAAKAAAVAALRYGAELTLLTVADVPVHEPDRERVADAVRQSRTSFVERLRHELGIIAPGLTVHDRLVLNEAAAGILEESTRLGAELLVLGRTGWTRSPRQPMGTVVQRVMTHSDASVLVIP